MTRASAFVLGYHGCDRTVGENVLAGMEHLRPSDNDYDWLGSGIYFWENSARKAMDWARFCEKNPQFTRATIREPFVVGAIIDLGLCLDLLEAESISVVANGYKGLCESCDVAGIDLPTNKKFAGELILRRLDCTVLNYVHESREQQGEPAFESVRAPFIEGLPLYENAGFHERTHIQICVRNSQQIIGYFRPIALT
jgi:hypothetical protein